MGHSEENRVQFQYLVLLSLLFLQISNTFVIAASNVHIVYMGERQHDDPAIITKSHHDMLTTLLGSKEAARDSILYSYRHGFSGFAAKLTKSQAELISKFDGVVRVIPNRIHKLHTTRSWEFLGLKNSSPGNLLSLGHLGEGIIVGVIDSGIRPESESFSNKNMGPIPSRWKGICESGEGLESTIHCNRKIIGARWFIKGFTAEYGGGIIEDPNLFGEFLSPKDGNGHGTHTSSTAAGNLVENASVGGLAKGIARGGAPRSKIAVYKACWTRQGDCTGADVLKAFDQAIGDGVDIVSASIGQSVPLSPYIEEDDLTSIGSFHAVAKGIVVVGSAGNEGPYAQTVENTAPWIISVAATTIDRGFPTTITLGNDNTLLGQSLDAREQENEFTGIIDGGSCTEGTINATLAAGKVLLCFTNSLPDIGIAQVTAIILAKHPDNLPASYEYESIPFIFVNTQVGTEILSYIKTSSTPMVKLGHPKTVVGEWASPRVAYFSSRGPSSLSPAVLKPDIAAPGVNILAAKRDGFAFESGTSMSCAHVAGITALIKSLHPTWSPAAIKSAFVTTASITGTNGDPIAAEGGPRKQADPFDYGGGMINPNKAADPGLTYDMSTDDYIQFLCSMAYSNSAITKLTIKPTSCKNKYHPHSILNLNFPSIVVPNLKEKITIFRTVTNVGPINSHYKALVQSPPGIKIVVEPPFMSFNAKTTKITFGVTISSSKVPRDYTFGSLAWSDGEHLVRSPIVVRAVNLYSDADI